eukprot:gene9841-biopygen10775
MLLFPREGGPAGPVCPLRVFLSGMAFPSSGSELSGQISQELDFGGCPWPGAGALARGLVVPGRGPGVSR